VSETDLRETYQAVAAGWDRARSRALFERGWLDRFLRHVEPGAPVLDLGCGAGEPIARYLIERGHPVVGVDFAANMLALARARFPEQRWIEADMRALDLPERFGGVVAWDSFFHLTREEQRAMIPRFARHLAPGGALLFTCGPDDGEATGAVEGLPVPHASLSPAGYAAALEAAGLRPRAFTADDPDCAGHSAWIACAAS
jgi:ubiquinone/menaquinone biosynthesis C-methylase UbiE